MLREHTHYTALRSMKQDWTNARSTTQAMGAKVIAAASDDEKLALCKANGADVLVNYGHDGSLLKQVSHGE